MVELAEWASTAWLRVLEALSHFEAVLFSLAQGYLYVATGTFYRCLGIKSEAFNADNGAHPTYGRKSRDCFKFSDGDQSRVIIIPAYDFVRPAIWIWFWRRAFLIGRLAVMNGHFISCHSNFILLQIDISM
jgi:hypothetical protein